MNRKRSPLAVLAVALAAAALLASGALAAGAKSYVLQLSDLGSGFSLQKTAVLTNAVAASDGSVTVAQLRKWGRITGYEADYAFEKATPATRGPIVVMSKVSLYRKTSGASAAFKASVAYAKTQLAKLEAKPLSSKRFGDDSWAFSYRTTSSGLEMVAYLYTWRVGARSAALMTAGMQGKLAQRDAEALVAKQLARMKR